jgi:hypothetical protein
VVVTKMPAGHSGWIARLAPLALRTSQTIRLQRLHKGAVYKEDLGQVALPLARGADVAAALVSFLRDMVPAEGPPADRQVASRVS